MAWAEEWEGWEECRAWEGEFIVADDDVKNAGMCLEAVGDSVAIQSGHTFSPALRHLHRCERILRLAVNCVLASSLSF